MSEKKALEAAAAFLMSPSHQQGRMQLDSELQSARKQVEALQLN
jgi:hypothetical protein